MRTGAAHGYVGHVHEAGFYSSDAEFLALIVPFMTGGIAAGEPTKGPPGRHRRRPAGPRTADRVGPKTVSPVLTSVFAASAAAQADGPPRRARERQAGSPPVADKHDPAR